MYRVYLNKETNVVEQVFDLTSEPTLADMLKEVKAINIDSNK